MRHFFAFFVFCMLGISHAFTESPLAEVEDLIQGGLFKNSEVIRMLSNDLTDPDRKYLFEAYGKKPQIPGITSMTLGLGIGSFLQGDTPGGLLGAAGDLLGIGLFAGFYISYGNTLRHNLSGQGERDPGYLALGLAASSLVVLIANRAIQLGRTIAYATRYNTMLKTSLGM